MRGEMEQKGISIRSLREAANTRKVEGKCSRTGLYEVLKRRCHDINVEECLSRLYKSFVPSRIGLRQVGDVRAVLRLE